MGQKGGFFKLLPNIWENLIPEIWAEMLLVNEIVRFLNLLYLRNKMMK